MSVADNLKGCLDRVIQNNLEDNLEKVDIHFGPKKTGQRAVLKKSSLIFMFRFMVDFIF